MCSHESCYHTLWHGIAKAPPDASNRFPRTSGIKLLSAYVLAPLPIYNCIAVDDSTLIVISLRNALRSIRGWMVLYAEIDPYVFFPFSFLSYLNGMGLIYTQ